MRRWPEDGRAAQQQAVRDLDAAIARLAPHTGDATAAADAAIKGDRRLERVYRAAMARLLEDDDLREVTARRDAINGFGRIGRSFVRSAYERGADLEIVAVNDIADPATLGHLFTYDSVYGQFPAPVTCEGDVIAFDGREIRVLSERAPGDLPWAELGVGRRAGGDRPVPHARRRPPSHLEAGARKVILSAPGEGRRGGRRHHRAGRQIDQILNKNHRIISNASCTTNCLVPMVKVLHESFGIVKGLMTTIHAYTNDQTPPGRAPQGPAPGAGRGAEPDPDVHRRRQGASGW